MSDTPQTGTRQSDAQIAARDAFVPRVDVSESDKDYRIELDLPGVTQNAIDVRVVEGTLIIRAELREEASSEPQTDNRQPGGSEPGAANGSDRQRRYHYRERRWGRFERVFHLPVDADDENIGADFSNGVLTLIVPKKVAQIRPPQGRQISISSAAEPTETKELQASTNS